MALNGTACQTCLNVLLRLAYYTCGSESRVKKLGSGAEARRRLKPILRTSLSILTGLCLI